MLIFADFTIDGTSVEDLIGPWFSEAFDFSCTYNVFLTFLYRVALHKTTKIQKSINSH